MLWRAARPQRRSRRRGTLARHQHAGLPRLQLRRPRRRLGRVRVSLEGFLSGAQRACEGSDRLARSGRPPRPPAPSHPSCPLTASLPPPPPPRTPPPPPP